MDPTEAFVVMNIESRAPAIWRQASGVLLTPPLASSKVLALTSWVAPALSDERSSGVVLRRVSNWMAGLDALGCYKLQLIKTFYFLEIKHGRQFV